MCGEKRHGPEPCQSTAGSPPRVRGKVQSLCKNLERVGITPAYAGKRQERSSYRTNRRDHPRVCGEKSFTRLSYCSAGGSPPRVRGKVPVCCPEHRKVRITPAYAGKRDLVISESGDIEDHPRVCGEKPQMYAPKKWMKGSPPRVRGKERTVPEQRSGNGITPACAGKSSASSSSVHRSRDHPRVCGEKRKTGAVPAPLPGSPPRMRGKGEEGLRRCLSERITPAYAGKRSGVCLS